MNPLEKNEVLTNVEDPDFDQEKVWKKIFKKVECDFCSDDGDCSFFDLMYPGQKQKCSKWDDFKVPCRGGGICSGTVSISFINPGAMTWTNVSFSDSTTMTWNTIWTVSYGT